MRAPLEQRPPVQYVLGMAGFVCPVCGAIAKGRTRKEHIDADGIVRNEDYYEHDNVTHIRRVTATDAARPQAQGPGR